ncbi:AAA domain-containing protein [Actinacidiphila epipremni]|uniref:AAA family ATPase n=1 Tax=Actinacidiphila epipremni TaxID=2053013 RepID=A0ABX0ZMN5_9ACTN|nr:AAA domain-containing protein [Actinacidiphila epipremni]NJP44511.1 AAA family ATPase [Actinacidiphila epipremni]
MAEAGRPYPVAELLAAVRSEIAAERRGDGKDAEKVALGGGRRVSSGGGRTEYVFTCRTWNPALDGAPVLARPSRSRGPWSPAEASRMPDGTVRLLVEGPGWEGAVTNAQLRRDDAESWAVMAQRLEAVGTGSSTVRPASAGWVLGKDVPRTARDPDPGRWVAGWSGLRLNPRQRQAIEQALASQVLFLWGPPGTGKTDVVGHIVEGSVRQGLTVLFLAPTKVAVDQALERVCDLLHAEPGFADGLVQRAGDIELPSLAERYGDRVDTARITARISARLDADLTDATTALSRTRTLVAHHDEAAALDRQLTDARAVRAAHVQAAKDAESEQVRAEAEAAALRLKIHELGAPKGMFAKRKAERLAQLHEDLARSDTAAATARRAAADSTQSARRSADTLDDLKRRLTAARSRLAGVPPRPELAARATRLQGRVDALDKQRRQIQDTVRAKCRVMGATVTKAVQSRKLLDRVDVVVVDEAGMVSLPAAWLVAGLAAKRLVVAGDFRQLPAVVKGDTDPAATDAERAHARRWTAQDPFHAAGLVDPAGQVRPAAHLVALDTQYRMRAPICDLVNTVAYPDARLTTGRPDRSSIPFNGLIDAPVLLVDTSAQRIPGRDHRTNTVNEAVIHEIVRGLQFEGVLPGRKWAPDDIAPGERATDRLGVIAPYRDQVRALKGSLSYRFGQDYDLLVDTIHRFQGSQRPVVVLDTVAGAGRSPGYFYQGTGLDSQTCRLLNVALSRAQDHLVVVADVDHLGRHLAPHSEARRMLDHLRAHAQTLSADQLVPTRDAAQLRDLSDEELARPAFFPADEVHRAVEWDIAHARTSVEIYCAFLDPRPVRTWSARLAARTAAGVRVVVHTRPPEEQRDTAAAAAHQQRIDELRSAGCEVDFRERMHEKVLILDAAVLWHGSLNLLANSGPTDLMMRFTDPASCARVGRVMDRARKDRAAWNPRNTAAAPQPPAGEGVRPGAVVGGRLYLDVPFAEKDEAKRTLKARWDSRNSLWHVDAALVTREQAARWLP